jgi:hypothetical protein
MNNGKIHYKIKIGQLNIIKVLVHQIEMKQKNILLILMIN